MSRRIAIGDIHGCLKTLKGLLEEKIKVTMEDQILFIGDYIDRGPDSKGVLDYLLEKKEKGFNYVFIRGNHEEMLIESFSSDVYFQPWMNNGGGATLDSFGISREDYLAPGGNRLPETYMDFLSSTTYYLELENCYIVHAGFNFHDKRPFEDLDAMIWSRNFDYDRGLAKGKKVIHGHTPATLDNIRATLFDPDASLINIDAGCVYTEYPGMGNLLGLNIDNFQLFVQANID
jgi:serine/threonine protein phosphatase 1